MLLRKAGLLSKPLDKPFKAALVHHLKQGVPDHRNVRQLMPYSYFVRFIVKTRNFFMNEFTKYRHEFNGINGECLFLARHDSADDFFLD